MQDQAGMSCGAIDDSAPIRLRFIVAGLILRIDLSTDGNGVVGVFDRKPKPSENFAHALPFLELWHFERFPA
jgi:hypothetical protein